MTTPQLPERYQTQPYQPDAYLQQPFSPAPPPTLSPYGVDPATGGPLPPPYAIDRALTGPLSDKNKVVAGLLQLLPGFLFGLGGIGRLYAGHTGLGLVQLAATLLGWFSFWGAVLLSVLIVPLLGFVVYFCCWLWFVIDGIVLMAGRPTDGQGRLLRS